MRKILLSAIALLFTFMQLAAQNCLVGWNYKAAVTVTNPNAVPLTDFQVAISFNSAALISAGHMQASGNDLRFTQNNCCDTLCYWIESGLNSANTIVWVKIPSLPASGSTQINMVYGNPAALSASNPECVFDFYEGFDGNALRKFTQDCGSPSASVSGGSLNLSWSSMGKIVSDSTFLMANVYTAEANITAATGSWPGLDWYQTSDQRGYALLLGSSRVRISYKASAGSYCNGENWASPEYVYSGVTGIWQHTWIATGNIVSYFPGYGALTSTDVNVPRGSDLKLCLGGVSSGSGSMTVDWVRVRKYAALTPAISIGAEAPFAFFALSLGPDTTICREDTITLSGSPGYTSFHWSTGAVTQSIQANAQGYYTLTAQDTIGCTGIDSILVSWRPQPNPALGPDTTACPGINLNFASASSFPSYMWNNGAMVSSQSFNTSGWIWLEVTDTSGCMGRDSVLINRYNVVNVYAGADTNICDGSGGVSLSGSNGYSNYVWTPGGPGQTINAILSGNYVLTAVDANGCNTRDTVHVGFFSPPIAAFTYTSNGLQVNFTNATGGNTTCNWNFGDSTYSNAVNPVHTFSGPGTYHVCMVATSPEGCDSTACQDITVTGVGNAKDWAKGEVRICPNPSSGELRIEAMHSEFRDVNIRIVDAEGRLVLQRKADLQAGAALVIDASNLASGVYRVMLNHAEGQAAFNWMKR